jgi:hypothetical protein
MQHILQMYTLYTCDKKFQIGPLHSVFSPINANKNGASMNHGQTNSQNKT